MSKIATRDGFGDEIVELGRENKNILVVDVDIGKSCKTTNFAKQLPAQHVNVGIAEQSGAGVAAGLATCGKIPFVVTYAAFGSMRMCEMIRQEICYPHLNVKIACSHGGVTPANDGASHQCIEDMGILSTIPGMTVVMPADYNAARKLTRAAAEFDGTVQMDIHSTSIISSIDKRLMVSCLPWTFSDYQAAEDAFFGAGGEFVSSVLAEHGLTYLGALHNGFKCMTSSKCQIKAPSDLVGQKIRTPGGDLWNGFWSALGASPQAMSWSEVYTAMQQKTIDGHDNSPSTINSANVQEVQKYITVSNHTYEAFTWSANSDWYNGLNEATQELIASCAKQACLDANKQIEDSMEKILSNWEGNGYNEIYRLSDSEIEVFKEAVASVTEQYANEYGQEACTAFGINVAS